MTHTKCMLARSAFLSVAIILLPAVVLAQKDVVSPIAEQALALANILVTLVFVLSVVAFGWGVVAFVMAADDPAVVQKAKGFLLWGVIGMAVAASLFGFIVFLQTYAGVRGGRLIITPPEVQEGGTGAAGGGGTGGSTAATGGPTPPPPPPPPGTTTAYAL